MELFETSATQIAADVKSGKVSSEKVAEAFLSRIAAQDRTIGAFLRVDKDDVLAQARAVDSKKHKGHPLGSLAGVPVGIKDNILVRGQPASCASKILQNFKAPYDATVIERLKAAGAILVGRANMDEFAMGSSTENSAYQKTKNPWDITRIPGGSSGGSAAAVAARFVPLALGSDTGGSIRQPAALCGIFGLKPTYGRVSRYGLVAFASSLDQIGPLAHNCADLALLQQTIEGHDPKDSTSASKPGGDYNSSAKNGLSGMRLGIPKEYFIAGLDPAVEKAVRDSMKLMEKQGAQLREISLPHTEYAIATYYIVATAEASSNLARYDGVKYGMRWKPTGKEKNDLLDMYENTRSIGFGPEVKRRILLGTYVLSAGYYDAYYLKALRARRLIHDDFRKAFEQCDAIVTPTTPTVAFQAGERTKDPLQMYLSDIFTISVNLAGIPAVSIPCGFGSGNMPIGLQILGKPFDEATLLKISAVHEANSDYHLRIPAL